MPTTTLLATGSLTKALGRWPLRAPREATGVERQRAKQPPVARVRPVLRAVPHLLRQQQLP